MKEKSISGLATVALALGLAFGANAQPIPLYLNQGTVLEPHPQVDAFAFFNDTGAIFEGGATATTGGQLDNDIELYTTSSTLNYTNRGFLIFSPGVDIRTFPSGTGIPQPAANFVNQGNGLTGGIVSSTATPWSGFVLYGPTQVRISATNIINSGLMDCGQYIEQYFGSQLLGTNVSGVAAAGLIQLNGNDINLVNGTISMPNPVDIPTDFTFGLLDEYWGVNSATNPISPLSFLAGFTPFDQASVTTRNFIQVINGGQIALANPKIYANQFQINQSNILNQVAFIGNLNPLVTNLVSFNPGAIEVEWQWPSTNQVSGVSKTNFLILQDSFGEVTNLQVVQDGVAIPQARFPRPTFIPITYFFTTVTNFFGPPSAPDPNGAAAILGSSGLATNQWAAYETIFSASTQLTTDLPENNPTNFAGRIEINSANSLNLTNARLSALAYVLVKATNSFLGAQGAQISAPNFDYFLRTTNGVLMFSNLVPAYVDYPSGTIQLWSARWTNIDVTGLTNEFHVLFVNSAFTPTTTPFVQTLDLTVTNMAAGGAGDLFISDILNVTSNVTLRARSLTITTNGPAAHNAFGELNLLSGNFVFPDVTPGLLYLTNYGLISAGNTIFFAGLPFNQALADNPPYATFVNHGTIIDGGSSIWARYFENGGTLSAGVGLLGQASGSIRLQDAVYAIVTNSSLSARGGAISLTADNQLLSNSVFQADDDLTLTANNILSDGIPNIAILPLTNQLTATVSNANSWSCSGLQLPVKPASGDLLGTKILCTAPTNITAPIIWAAEDRGPGVYVDGNSTGFFNNAAVGQLIVDAKDKGSRFSISGPSSEGNFALYVDYLELRNAATNIDNLGNYTAFQFAPNMKIYFGQAVANGFSIAEKLAGLFATNPPNGGHFVWVSNYNYGYFSSTNIIYLDGTTNRVNAALAQSPDLNTPFPPHPVWSPAGTDVPTFPDQPFFFGNPLNLGKLQVSNAISGTLASMALEPINNSALTFGKISGPNWLSVAPNGALSGIPGEGDIGTNLFVVNVTSPGLLTDTTTARVIVVTNILLDPPAGQGAPVIEPPPVASDTSSTSDGVYYGLASDSSNGVSVASSGYVTINVTARSNYTAKLQLAGHTYSFSGSLKNGVSVSTSSGNNGPLLKLRLQQSGPDQIHGSVSNGSARWSADLVADRLVFNKVKNPANSANYTMIIPPQPNSANGPGGYGNGTVKVDANGKVQWAGTLADGTKVTQGTAISKDGYWPLYSSLYGSRGLAIGWMQTTNEAGSDMNGTVVWIKPKGTVVKAYSGNFTNCVQASGMVYKTDARTSVLNLSDGSVTLTGGALGTNTVICPFTLDTRNHVGGTSKMKMVIKPGNGLITGSAVDPVHGKLSFQGVVLQGSTNGFGFFLNSGESGQVELSPGQ